MANKSEWEVELEDDVTPGARRAESSLGRLRRAFERFNRSGAARAAQQFASVAKQVIAVGAAIGAGVAAAVTSMTVSMVDFNQRSILAFTQLAKHGEVPQELFQRSIDLAKRFGLDIKGTTKQIAKFRALQFSQDQAEGLIKAGADMQALGASSEEVTRIFAQLGQIQAKGKLQGEELIVLAENGLSTQLVYENLEKQLGKTREEILKMQQAGKIDSSSALNAITAAILQKTGSSELGEAGAKVAEQTLSGMSGRLRAGFQDLFRRAAVESEPAIASAFAPISERLFALFEDPATAGSISSVVTAIAGAVEKALPFVEAFLSAFGEGFMATLPAIMDGFSVVLDLFGEMGGSRSTADTVAMIGKALGEVAAILTGALVAALAIAAGAIVWLASVWNGLKTALIGIVDTFGAVVFGIVDFFANLSAIFNANGLSLGEKAWKIGVAIVQGIVSGIKSLLSLPLQVLQSAASGWISAVKSTLGIASPSKVFEDIGMNTALGFNLGMENEMPTVQGAASMLGSSSGFASAGGGTSNTFAPVITVPLSGSATREDGEAFAAGISDRLFAKWHSLLEDSALEQGV